MFPCQLGALYVSWWPMIVRVTQGVAASKGVCMHLQVSPARENHVGVVGSLSLFGG